MCGIVGQVAPRGRPVQPGLLERMCARLEHRGPDARGHPRATAASALGIQRLRVIDLATGDQPIYNEDRSVAVVLNGEIYNYRELRDRPRARAATRFATQGDTEVIVHLYEEYGEDCVRHLHGMFAFALWDHAPPAAAARARPGRQEAAVLRASATARSASPPRWGRCCEDAEIPRELDHEALDAYLAYGYVPAPLTRAARRAQAAAGAHARLRGRRSERRSATGSSTTRRKLDGVPVDGALRAASATSCVTATRRRLIADVPLGAFLSGGIDSSAVVAAMAEASSEPVQDVLDRLRPRRGSTSCRHARRVAERFGTDPRGVPGRAPTRSRSLPKLVRHYGEPFADSSAIPSFYLAEMARRHVTVALNGDGGDESFGGYTRYVANRVAGRLDRLPPSLRRRRRRARRPLPGERQRRAAWRNKARRLAGALALDGPDRYARYMSWFDQRAAP